MTHILIIDPQFNGDPDIEREVAGPDVTFEIVRPGEGDVDPDALRDADAVINCRSRHRLPGHLVAHCDKTKIIVQAGVGFNHIDIEAFARRGIPVCNTPDYGTVEVADHAMALFLDLMRATTAYNNRLLVSDNAWGTHALPVPPIRRIKGLTFGIVGLGRIGLATAMRARAFELNIAFHDPYLPAGVEHAVAFQRQNSLEALLERSDIVSLHCPLTPETTALIDSAAMARMKPGAILINTARGAAVDLDAVYGGLKDGHLGAAGLDVLKPEPLDRAHPLIAAWTNREDWLEGRLILTPHAAFYTPESLRDMRRLSMLAAVQYLREKRLRSCINLAHLHKHGFAHAPETVVQPNGAGTGTLPLPAAE